MLLFPFLLICIPLSFPVGLFSVQINFPVEPILGVMAILLIYVIDVQSLLRSRFIRHPLTVTGVAYHLWMLLIIPFSSNVIVSLKYTLVNLVAYCVFYFGFYHFSARQGDAMLRWAGYYSLGFLLVMVYALVHHGLYNFSMDTAQIAVRPFYNDHAIYGASAALLVVFLFITDDQIIIKKEYSKLIGYGLIAALFFSFSRAAWLSVLIGSGLVLAIRLLKLKFVGLLACVFILILLLSVLIISGPPFTTVTSQAKKGDWFGHLKSIGNISSDVSNLERINRYHCALRMWVDRPVAGFGPGTFQYEYLSYQKPVEMTRLSVTTSTGPDGKPHPIGRGGGAHSEYFRALAEMGFPGLMGWVGFVLISIHTAFRLYYLSGDRRQKSIILAILFGLTTYFIHALFNDFLHSEEIAALFWAELSALAVFGAYNLRPGAS